MTYTKTNWVDQAGQVKYTKSEDGGYWILTPNYEDVSPIGTPVNADNLNHIENGISDCDTAITELQEEVTAIYPKLDGPWVINVQQEVVSNLNLNNANGTPYPIDLSGYLPNDGYNYEVIIDGNMETGSTSGRYCAFIVQSGLGYGIYLGNGRPRTNASVTSAGNGIIVVGADRKLYIARANNYYGIATLDLKGYRRVRTNE